MSTTSAVEPKSIWRVALLWAVPLLAILAGLSVWAFGGRYLETDNAYLKTDLVPVFPEIEARVSEVLVEENARVAEGTVIVKLDDEAAAIDVRRAEARFTAVREELAALRRQLEQRRNELSLAQEQMRYSDRELTRQRELVERKLAPASRFDAAEHESLQAKGRMQVIAQGIEELEVRLGPALSGNVDSHPLVREASAELESARLRLSRAVIAAPEAGRVVKLPQRGAMARRTASLFTLVRSEKLWVEANFKETQLEWIRSGQRATIRLDSYPGVEWRGHVDTIAPASGSEFAMLPAQNASGNWVKVVQRVSVRIAIDEGPTELPLRAGTSAVVVIDPQAGNRLHRFVSRR